MRMKILLLGCIGFTLSLYISSAQQSYNHAPPQLNSSYFSRKREIPQFRTVIEADAKRQRVVTPCLDIYTSNKQHCTKVDLKSQDPLWGNTLIQQIEDANKDLYWVIARVPGQESGTFKEIQIYTNGRLLFDYITREQIHEWLPFHAGATLNVRFATYYLIERVEGQFTSQYIGTHADTCEDTVASRILCLILAKKQKARQFCTISDCYFELGKFEESIAWLRRAQSKLAADNKPTHHVLHDIGIAHFSLGSYDTAVRFLYNAKISAQDAKKKYGYILANLGTLAWNKGKIREAIKQYDEALLQLQVEQQPIDWVLCNLARAYEYDGKLMCAIHCYSRAIKNNIRYVPALAHILRLAAQKKEEIVIDPEIVSTAAHTFAHIAPDQPDMENFKCSFPECYAAAAKAAQNIVLHAQSSL
jgi:tetratricopeptide (TPR) repeat protein